jgi:hypothetical protein
MLYHANTPYKQPKQPYLITILIEKTRFIKDGNHISIVNSMSTRVQIKGNLVPREGLTDLVTTLQRGDGASLRQLDAAAMDPESRAEIRRVVSAYS